MVKKRRRGSSMGSGTRNSRKQRKMGKKWLTLPKGFSLYKEEAETTIKMDILPYIVADAKKHPESENISEDVWYRFPYRIHRSIGPSREAVLCPGTIGKPCPICEQMQEIYDDPDADNKQAGKFRPAKRSLFIIKIKAGDKKNKGKTFIWDMSDYCFFDQVDTELEHGEEEWNDFACLEGGYTLKVRFLEESFDKTKYAMADRIDFIERDDYDEALYDEMPCLDDIVIPNIKTVKEIQSILDGEETSQEDDNEEEEVKEKSKKKTKTKEKKAKKEKKPPKLEWDDISEADEDELLELVSEQGLEVEEDDYDDEDELRSLLAEELNIKKPKKKSRPKKENKSECPYKYKFGHDFQEQDECEDCEEKHSKTYDKCFDAYDELQEE